MCSASWVGMIDKICPFATMLSSHATNWRGSISTLAIFLPLAAWTLEQESWWSHQWSNFRLRGHTCRVFGSQSKQMPYKHWGVQRSFNEGIDLLHLIPPTTAYSNLILPDSIAFCIESSHLPNWVSVKIGLLICGKFSEQQPQICLIHGHQTTI